MICCLKTFLSKCSLIYHNNEAKVITCNLYYSYIKPKMAEEYCMLEWLFFKNPLKYNSKYQIVIFSFQNITSKTLKIHLIYDLIEDRRDIQYFLVFSENHRITLFWHFRIHSNIVTSFYSFLQPQQNSRPTCLHGGGHDRHLLYPRSDFIGSYPK